MADAAQTQGLTPLQAFEDNIRPARLMLKIYRLLNCQDAFQSDGEFVEKLRGFVAATAAEDLLVLQNEIFVGLVREKAEVPKFWLRTATLCNLLRQAIVASCTALESYLPALLRQHMDSVISARGRNFVPKDKEVNTHFKDLQFTLEEVLRVMTEQDAALYLSNKLIRFIDFRYTTGARGVHVVGVLLGLTDPWSAIADHLGKQKDDLRDTLETMVNRRNDIVHRADRGKKQVDGGQQELTYAQANQGVEAIYQVCITLDELVNRVVPKTAPQAAAPVAQGVAVAQGGANG